MDRVKVAKELLGLAKLLTSGKHVAGSPEFPAWQVTHASDNGVYLTTIISPENPIWSGSNHNQMQKALDASVAKLEPKIAKVMMDFGIRMHPGAKAYISKASSGHYSYAGRIEFNAEPSFVFFEFQKAIEKAIG